MGTHRERETENPTGPGAMELRVKSLAETLEEAVLKERKRRAENIVLVFRRGDSLVGEYQLEDNDIRQDLVIKWKKKKLNTELDDLLLQGATLLPTQQDGGFIQPVPLPLPWVDFITAKCPSTP